MADLLVRKVSANLKQEIEKSARQNKRTLSDEVKTLIQIGLSHKKKPLKMGTFISTLLEDKYRGNDLVFDRNDLVAPPPNFE